jgi:hypothetical protein
MERAANEAGSSAIGIVSEFTSLAAAALGRKLGARFAAGTRGPQLVNFSVSTELARAAISARAL